MSGKKRLNPFSYNTMPDRYFHSAWVYRLLLYMGRYGVKAGPACTVAKDADFKWRKMQWRVYAKWR